MNAVTTTKAKDSLRIMISSLALRDAALAALAAVLLAAAFPKVGAAWLVPFGTALLFWLWQGASWKRAALLGWFAGLVFFAFDFAWVGHTVGRYIGVFGPFLAFGPALIEAPFFALAGVLASFAYARVRPIYAPLAAAAGFTLCEWLRSIGVLAAPFDQLGYTQADTPLRAIAAFAGTYGITLVLCIVGAYAADAVHREEWRRFAGRVDRDCHCRERGVDRVARAPSARTDDSGRGVQGNIPQSFKWNALALAAPVHHDDAETSPRFIHVSWFGPRPRSRRARR